MTAPGGGKNYLNIDLGTNSTSGMNNVSDIKDAVLVLRNYRGEYPNQILCVLNWDPTAKEQYSLEDLKDAITTLGNDTDGYVMSNSVYVDGNNQAVDAVPLTINNIFTDPEEAKANPITIYVERVAAKVTVSTTTDNKYDIGKTIGDTKVYAKVVSCELYNDHEKSYLLKNIEGFETWTGNEFGFTNWNDLDWFRSYWANSINEAFPNNNFKFTDKPQEFVYCGENTKYDPTNPVDTRTKVIVKARLVKEDGLTPVEVCNWLGFDYIGEENLLASVANTLNYYSSPDAVTYSKITAEDLKCVRREAIDEKPYEVYFQLKDSNAKVWYEKNANGSYSALSNTNAKLKEKHPALVYKNGMTYYYTDIKHLGTEDSATEFGVVRNHVYKVNITKISGYGTPYYDTEIAYIKPEKPVDVTSYVAAKVNILSWRVVENDYEL